MFYLVEFSLQSAIDQADVIAKIKADGGDAIQTSHGLCLKTSRSMAALKDLIPQGGVKTTALDPAVARADAATAKDILTFLES